MSDNIENVKFNYNHGLVNYLDTLIMSKKLGYNMVILKNHKTVWFKINNRKG